jgi:predicted amidohydrolase YtcJ
MVVPSSPSTTPPRAEAVAVKDEKIIAVGKKDDVLKTKGDWHRDHTVGPVLAENISPTGWCIERGMMFTTHHDAPVAFPDSMRVLDATVTRRSRSGDILGPHQRVDVMTALKAMTLWPAWQYFEEKNKGSIDPGKLAGSGSVQGGMTFLSCGEWRVNG